MLGGAENLELLQHVEELPHQCVLGLDQHHSQEETSQHL
jgi:hypothetical protein